MTAGRTIIGTAIDIDGQRYDVIERRHATGCPEVELGLRPGQRGGVKVILTEPLARYLEHRRDDDSVAIARDLPIVDKTVRRLRTRLGHTDNIGTAIDIDGQRYDVRERRHAPGCPEIEIGWPEGRRGKGVGAPKVILTEPLARYLERRRDDDSVAIARDLPIGDETVRRLRTRLGHRSRPHQHRWRYWDDRLEDLATMTNDEFAQKHSVSASSVSHWRRRLLGNWRRDAGWWLADDVVAILMSDAPLRDIGSQLNLSASTVKKMRSKIRRMST